LHICYIRKVEPLHHALPVNRLPVKHADGSRTPAFIFYRRTGDSLGTAVADGLDLKELLAEVGRLG